MLFIDDQGRLWDCASLKLHLGLKDLSVEFDEHVTQNLGFIALEARPASFRIRLKPAIASPVALAALFHKLADDRPARVIVSCLGAHHADELCGSWRDATDRISRLVFKTHQNASRAFLIQRLPTEHHLDAPLRALLNRWRDTERRFSRAAFDEVLRTQLAGRHVIVESRVGHAGVTLLSIGDGFFSYNEHWRRQIVGRSMEIHPDYYYGKWAANLYREAVKEEGPRLDNVDVMVKRVGETPRRVRYRRLILPFQVSPDVKWLLGASIVDPSINLRAEG